MKNTSFVPLINDSDKETILKLINENIIDIKNLHINIENGKYISGIFGTIDEEIKNYFKYNHFIESINDLSSKTKLSIEKSVEAYQKVNSKKYNPMNNLLTEYEMDAYYYMENALFRELILWDSLAQLYNLYFNLNKDVKKVSYKKVIRQLAKEHNENINFKKLLSYIEEYHDADSDIDTGIHDEVCELRNQMTHRYSIAITSLSENTNLRAMPDSLYRIASDYNVVQRYLVQIINLIINKINVNNVVEKIKSGMIN